MLQIHQLVRIKIEINSETALAFKSTCFGVDNTYAELSFWNLLRKFSLVCQEIYLLWPIT